MMDSARNGSQQPGYLPAFGFIMLPQEYEVEQDVVVSLVGVMSLISVIANTVFLLVIIYDPLKQLRTITAILLAFNSAANMCISLVLFIDAVLFWSDSQFSPELVVYLTACGASLYFVGNLLHTVTIYETIVVPIRYAHLAPKARKVLVKLLGIIFAVTTCVIVIPPYLLPESKMASFVKGIMTLVLVEVVLLTLTFIYLYTKIFQALYARSQRLKAISDVQRATSQGKMKLKQNSEIAKTLFIHVLFFVFATAPFSVITMIFLHCTTCSTKLQLAILFMMPCVFTTFVFHPFLWLFRLNSYREAMKLTLSFRRSRISESTNNNRSSVESKEKKTASTSF